MLFWKSLMFSMLMRSSLIMDECSDCLTAGAGPRLSSLRFFRYNFFKVSLMYCCAWLVNLNSLPCSFSCQLIRFNGIFPLLFDCAIAVPLPFAFSSTLFLNPSLWVSRLQMRLVLYQFCRVFSSMPYLPPFWPLFLPLTSQPKEYFLLSFGWLLCPFYFCSDIQLTREDQYSPQLNCVDFASTIEAVWFYCGLRLSDK